MIRACADLKAAFWLVTGGGGYMWDIVRTMLVGYMGEEEGGEK